MMWYRMWSNLPCRVLDELALEICGAETLTYWELRDKIQHCAAGFRRKSIGKGDRVYVHIANSIESFVAVSGVISTGATFVSSDIMWREGKRRSGFDSVHEFCGDDEVLNEFEGLDSSGASFVEWTTGTTGLSKGVEIPHDRFLRKVSSFVGVEMLAADDVLLGDCNISSYIMFFTWTVALHHGSTIAISKTCHTVPLDLFDVIKNIEIIDEVSQEVLGPMQRGEVLVDTPYAAAWYCGRSGAATDIIDEQGWLHTGDLGYYDHDGRLFLCGRLKTMLVCQTRKVAPVEIEHCLLEHAAVEEVAVLGVPAPDGEEFPAAVVVTKRGHCQDQKLANDLKRFVAVYLEPNLRKGNLELYLQREMVEYDVYKNDLFIMLGDFNVDIYKNLG
ncbi:hypothetical protein HPB50_019544 [Hyalomma asiaticum]|uniref:Uncharacterized protein n=1 Tax=Hyalomma asiaticum TaxID=266040 RepID=A0ACB7SX84_HYAAI|nr:hypothetical protein HPB50_019544 [Hyalomma asiaticum]